jgi:hypothetical protein
VLARFSKPFQVCSLATNTALGVTTEPHRRRRVRAPGSPWGKRLACPGIASLLALVVLASVASTATPPYADAAGDISDGSVDIISVSVRKLDQWS